MSPFQPFIDFGTVLSGILFVALPFVALGVVTSNVIQHYVSQERLHALYGRGLLRNYLVSATAGFIFPLCECGIVPVARGLSKKGVPNSAVVMFLLSAPVLNPITLGATIAAFPARPTVWIGRVLISQALTLIIGWIFQAFRDPSGVPLPMLKNEGAAVACAHDEHESALLRVLTASYEELVTVFPYILLGATITSALQGAIPQEFLVSLGAHPLLAIAVFMGFALVLSVCSAVDAFVILPFAGRIPFAALLAFLTYGPLIDVKNILLFRSYFTPRFQAWYLGLVTVLSALIAYLLWLVLPVRLAI